LQPGGVHVLKRLLPPGWLAAGSLAVVPLSQRGLQLLLIVLLLLVLLATSTAAVASNIACILYTYATTRSKSFAFEVVSRHGGKRSHDELTELPVNHYSIPL
jgi:hypothetical protein